MANVKKSKPKKPRKPLSPAWRSAFGFTALFFGFYAITASISFLINWKSDFSLLSLPWNEVLFSTEINANNALGRSGVILGYLLVYRWFGVAVLPLLLLPIFWGARVFWPIAALDVRKKWPFLVFSSLWIALFTGWLNGDGQLFSGGLGWYIAHWMMGFIGSMGTIMLLVFTALLYVVIHFDLAPDRFRWKRKEKAASAADGSSNPDETLTSETMEDSATNGTSNDFEDSSIAADPSTDLEESEQDDGATRATNLSLDASTSESATKASYSPEENPAESTKGEDVKLAIEAAPTEEELDEDDQKARALVDTYGAYDPRAELGDFKFPSIDLLKDYGGGDIQIDEDELEANKNRIVETLRNYQIEIAKITATIGPTITLYEIVPEAGIRISKIKNLEDDIALSLSALGIRIIAPIPGRGTIGIEVPNTHKQVVSMRSVIASKRFQQSDMELPIAFGKTISNETFVTDLAKMPHLLMAGATGQGKSVGLNAILTSLLYRKHPGEVKFVLVDPKKVELTLFNKIERHYLAKLPNEEEAIITDTRKVINTLNSLCIEMDDRYELLKNAMCRNIIEYNRKFTQRKLNPENGHKFMPYIVLVIDEFADLIMTAGKEVETPIARLAQLARAIGIHLIVATQRPSVNVITGIIKANFPARVAFRVTSKIDSRTILDTGGADQLIGKGDMLFSNGNQLTRLQCAFVDTPEVEQIVNFIGAQRAYADAHQLPEYVGDESGGGLEDDPDERDSKFEEAARIVVAHQQGSASLLQRKMKLGYNRAGRIVDQLEAAGIIGPFEGSKARQVLIKDEMALEQLLKGEE